MPKSSKKSSWSSPLNLVRMLRKKPSSTSRANSKGEDSGTTLSGKQHFAHFEDALKTKEVYDAPEPSSPVVCSTPARRSISTSASPSSNVIARLMGLDEMHTANSPKNKQQIMQREEQQKWTRTPERASPRRDSLTQRHTQEFLDEMEDHLMQCDRALERIEAVMQLKKRLLCMSSGRDMNTMPFYCRSPSRDFHSVNKHDFVGHVRAKSVDHILKVPMRQEQSWGYPHRYYSDTSTGRATSLASPQRPSRMHRRCNSDGGTPIFSPPRHAAASRVRAKTCFGPRHLTVEEACNLSRSVVQIPCPSPQVKPVVSQDSEQPSPVSVLDNNNDSSPGSSEDYEDVSKCSNVTRKERPRSKVVRALWSKTELEPADDGRHGAVEKIDLSNDIELLTWSDEASASFEVERVALVLECMIFKRLVEDTIAQLYSLSSRQVGR